MNLFLYICNLLYPFNEFVIIITANSIYTWFFHLTTSCAYGGMKKDRLWQPIILMIFCENKRIRRIVSLVRLIFKTMKKLPCKRCTCRYCSLLQDSKSIRFIWKLVVTKFLKICKNLLRIL